MKYLTILKPIFKWDKILRGVLLAALPASIFYLTALTILYTNGFAVMEILRDPAQQSGASSFLGFLSNIGIWLWVSSTAVCFFALLNGNSESIDKELLFLLGVFSLILAVDDFFMIHDRYLDQRICYMAYAITLIAILIRHSLRVIAINGFSFLLAGALLGLSVFTDLIQGRVPLSYSVVQIMEEGCKFIGAAVWLYFCAQVASNSLKPIQSRI